MATFPSLLNVGEPLVFQGVPAPRTVSPFASQLTSTGLLPLPAVPTAAPAPVPAPIAAPPAPAAALLSSGPNFRRSLFSFRDSETPTDAVDFTSATSAPSTSAIGAAEAFGLTAGTPNEIASAYATQRADEVSPRMSFGNLGSVFSQPLSKTLDQVFSRPEAVPGAILGMAIPGATVALSAMSNLNERNQAYNRAMAEMGQPGYSYGTIDGQKYSISPGPFGYGRVMSGVVPDWFDIDMHDKMQSLELGIDPNTGDTLVGFTPGIGGYNSKGQYVDAYANTMAMGTMGNLQTLANQQFAGNVAAARNALSLARQGIKPLRFKRRGYFDYFDDPGFGFDGRGSIGSGGVDEDAFSDAVATAAFDAFGAEFDNAAANSGMSIDMSIDYDVDQNFGYEDFSEADVSDGGGAEGDSGGDTHICTAAFKAGISPRERFRENKKYGIKLRREDPVLMRGYDLVGPWIAKKIGHTKMGNALTRLYAAKASGEKLSAKQKMLDATLNLTTRPALRMLGRFA